MYTKTIPSESLRRSLYVRGLFLAWRQWSYTSVRHIFSGVQSAYANSTPELIWLGVLSFFPFSLFLSGVASVSPYANGYFEVKEGETTNRLTCRELTSQDTVNWFAKGSFVGSCPPLSAGSSSDSCTPTSGALGEVFHPIRTSDAESVLNVDPVVHGFAAVERGGSLECRIVGGTKPTASCQMNYVCSFMVLSFRIVNNFINNNNANQSYASNNISYNNMIIIIGYY